jgi:hypothetical protein
MRVWQFSVKQGLRIQNSFSLVPAGIIAIGKPENFWGSAPMICGSTPYIWVGGTTKKNLL